MRDAGDSRTPGPLDSRLETACGFGRLEILRIIEVPTFSVVSGSSLVLGRSCKSRGFRFRVRACQGCGSRFERFGLGVAWHLAAVSGIEPLRGTALHHSLTLLKPFCYAFLVPSLAFEIAELRNTNQPN